MNRTRASASSRRAAVAPAGKARERRDAQDRGPRARSSVQVPATSPSHRNGGADAQVARHQPGPVRVGDHARAVVVGQHERVEVGQEARRAGTSGPGRGASAGRTRVRPRSSRNTARSGASPFSTRGERRRARSTPARRSALAGPKAAGGVCTSASGPAAGVDRRPQPALGGREAGVGRERPAVVRGHHHQGQGGAHRVAQRPRVDVREERRPGDRASAAKRARLLVEEGPRRREHRVAVQAGGAGAEHPDRALHHRCRAPRAWPGGRRRVWRWSVARIAIPRTTRRSVERGVQAGGARTPPAATTARRTAAAAPGPACRRSARRPRPRRAAARSSSSWRASVARPSSRRVSAGAAARLTRPGSGPPRPAATPRRTAAGPSVRPSGRPAMLGRGQQAASSAIRTLSRSTSRPIGQVVERHQVPVRCGK